MRHTTLCFLRKENKILLAMKKKGFGEGKLNGVGGKVEKDESVEMAALREAEEEIGIAAQILDLKKVAELSFNFKDKPEWGQLCHVFFLEKWDREPIESDEMKPYWFDIDKLPFDKMWVDDKIWVPHVLNDRKIIAEFVFEPDGSKIINHSVKEAESFS